MMRKITQLERENLKKILKVMFFAACIILLWTVIVSLVTKIYNPVDSNTALKMVSEEVANIESKTGKLIPEPNVLLTHNCEYNGTTYYGVYYFERDKGKGGENSVIALCYPKIFTDANLTRMTIRHEIFHEYQHEMGLPEDEEAAVNYSLYDTLPST